MKYYNEFMRAMKTATFFGLGILLGMGIIPWVMTEDKTVANAKLFGTLWGLVGAYAAAVALLFINEILRTKRLEKKAAETAAKKKK